MPELPEVETLRRQLAPAVEGRRLARVEIHDARWCEPLSPRDVVDAVAGRRVERLGRRGKYMVWELTDEVFLLMHLRMTGNLLYDPSPDVPYTRVTEYKHLTGQIHPKTSISYEYACADGDPYYPIPRPENQALYRQYEALARARSDVTFVGRLGTYKYYNMDQVVGQALATFQRIQAGEPATREGALVSA